MGCCVSSPQEAQTSDDRALSQATGTAAATNTSRRQQRHHRERTSLERRNTEARNQLLVGRGDAPTYRPHGTWTANPPVTHSELAHSRRAFWETADTFGGRKEIWDILRAAVDCDEQASAATMIEGADLRLLGDGDLIHGCYDPTGFFYKIPEYCLSDPTNLQKDEAPPVLPAGTKIVEEFPEAQLVDLKVRLSHTSQDLLVKVALQEKISSVSTKIQAATGVKQLKLMVLGRMLKDDGQQTLKDAGWTPGLIVQALVTQV